MWWLGVLAGRGSVYEVGGSKDTMPESLLTFIADYAGVPVDVLRSRTNRRTVAKARALYYALLRKQTGMSYPAMARTLNQDHSTAVKAVQRLNKARLEEPQ